MNIEILQLVFLSRTGRFSYSPVSIFCISIYPVEFRNKFKVASDIFQNGVIVTLLGLWLRLECSLDSLSIVSTDHQIDRGLSVSLRLYEMCHVLVIV